MPIKAAIRQTRPDYTFGYLGGIGIVPRRGWDGFTSRLLTQAALQPTQGLRQFYETAPQRLLQVFLSIHPMAKMASSNNLCLAFCPGDTRIVAVRRVETVQEDGTTSSSEEVDTEWSAALDTFWAAYDKGGLVGFQRAMGRQAEYAGMSCAEAVPGAPLQGVQEVATFEPITVLYEDLPDGTRVAKQFYQLQKVLDPNTCFIVPVDGDDDNPYGDPLFGAFLAEGLKDLGQEQNLSDILRGWAYPHVSIGFPFEEAVKFALAPENAQVLIGRGTNPDGTVRDLTAYEYAEYEFDKFCSFLKTVNPDDPLVMNTGSTAEVLDGASGMAALDPILRMRRHRMVMGLDQMPSLLGITDGGTQAYAQQQAKLSAKKLEFLRHHANGIVVAISNLHLRLCGQNLTARADTESIQSVDKLIEAQARSLDVATDKSMVDAGWLSRDDAASKHTGSGMVKPSGDPADGGEEDDEDEDE